MPRQKIEENDKFLAEISMEYFITIYDKDSFRGYKVNFKSELEALRWYNENKDRLLTKQLPEGEFTPEGEEIKPNEI